MAYKLKYKLFHLLFRLFSFLSDQTGGWRLFVKPKLYLGLLILGLSATACNSKGNKTATCDMVDVDVSEINSPAPESNTDSLAVDTNVPISYPPPVISCYDVSIEEPEMVAVSCYILAILPDTEIEKTGIFQYLEQMPQFPGGEEELLKFIQNNLCYIDIGDYQGRVFCRFVVNEDGSLSNIEILKSISPQVDKEAIRVIESMPKWIPGKHNGQNVKAYYTIPVVFKLED